MIQPGLTPPETPSVASRSADGPAHRKKWQWGTAALLALVAGAVVCTIALIAIVLPHVPGLLTPLTTEGIAMLGGGSDATLPPLTTAQIAALPEARYNAVISALAPYKSTTAPLSANSYTVARDAPIYDATRHKAVARFASNSFMGTRTVIVGVDTNAHWVQVLTPARQSLPSDNHGDAPAQTYGWTPQSSLTFDAPVTARIVVKNSAQTLTISGAGTTAATFNVGVGTPGTPTPTQVTGYLQARYLDAAQGESVYPIQLSSLHSSARDEPYGGKDGGLIGVHYQTVNVGAVSHGCIRLDVDAITAVNALPLGTLLTIEP